MNYPHSYFCLFFWRQD